MPKTKKTYRKPKRFFKKKRSALANARNVIDSARSLSDGTRFPISDAYDGYGRRNDIVPQWVPRNINDQVVWARSIYSQTANMSAVTETQLGYYFTLGLHPEHSSFETIFDQYCIPVVRLTLRTTETTTSLTSGLNMPRIYSVIDHDDANTISVAAAKEYTSCMEQRTTESVTRMVYPRIAQSAYIGAFTGYANTRSWLDCAADTVQHYGIKIAAEADTRTGGPCELMLEFEIYYAFRNRH
jgi:hypothetical protein